MESGERPNQLVQTLIPLVTKQVSVYLPDGQQLFIYKSTFDKKDNGKGDIYQSSLNGDVWTVPQKLGSDINTPDSWEN
jgi:hypothetical protein